MWPFDQLEVGDCLTTKKSIGALRQAVLRYQRGKGTGRQFTNLKIGGGYARCRRKA
jgi:hypothetical protein